MLAGGFGAGLGVAFGVGFGVADIGFGVSEGFLSGVGLSDVFAATLGFGEGVTAGRTGVDAGAADVFAAAATFAFASVASEGTWVEIFPLEIICAIFAFEIVKIIRSRSFASSGSLGSSIVFPLIRS